MTTTAEQVHLAATDRYSAVTLSNCAELQRLRRIEAAAEQLHCHAHGPHGPALQAAIEAVESAVMQHPR